MVGVIEYITLSTGHTRPSQRTEVSDRAIAEVRRDIAAGAALHRSHWRVRLVASPPGVHVYDLEYDGEHISSCWLCVEREASGPLWEIAVASTPRSPARQPRRTPWLAVAILPHVAIDPDVERLLKEAADLGRVVAWILIDDET